jgi:hypothetical protein
LHFIIYEASSFISQLPKIAFGIYFTIFITLLKHS